MPPPRRISPYLGPLGLVAVLLLGASGVVNVQKAMTFAPDGVYKVLAVAIGLAIIAGVARLPALPTAL